jgi:hypothetical protein
MDRSRHYTLLRCVLLSGLLASCRPESAAPKIGLSLDQGFEALFPTLSTSLTRAYGKSQEPGSTVLKSASIFVASPYSAARILETDAARGGSEPGPVNGNAAPNSALLPEPRGTTLIVPFAGPALSALPVVRSLGYDYDGAYARMGAEAAKALSRFKDGGKTACAIVFQPNFMRGVSALEAFSASFAAKAGEGKLIVKDLPSDPDAVDLAGAAAAAIREAEDGEVGLVVLAVDEQTQAVAAASAAVASVAVAAATKGGGSRIYFADTSTWDMTKVEKSLFAYRIEGDETAVARAVKLKTYRSFFKLSLKIF